MSLKDTADKLFLFIKKENTDNSSTTEQSIAES